MRILFDSKKIEYKKPFGALKVGELCSVSIKIPVDCPAIECTIVLNNDEGLHFEFPLCLVDTIDSYNTFTCNFSLNNAGIFFYYFVIKKPDSSFKLFKIGNNDTNIEDGDKWQLTCYPADFAVNNAFKGKIMYQIFPDRFNKKGNVDLSEKDTPYIVHKDLNDQPEIYANKEHKVWNIDFFGGNIRGIIDKIKYLKSFGVEILYLNPICKALSNHRYDTSNYKKIDPMLGSEKDLIKLCKVCHKNGIKVILDGVFSHTGSDSIYFDKYNRYGNGAISNPESSPYKSWYKFIKYPDEYEAWWGIKSLPAIDKSQPSYIDYIITSKDSVLRYWYNFGIDGFRLDVADELPDEFLNALYTESKKINPNSIIIGEVWEDASNKFSYGKRKEYFTNYELDTTMNYPFRSAIINLCLGNIDFEAFKYSILTILENYPSDSISTLMNSLSTHDTPRILTVLSEVSLNSKEEKLKYKLNSVDRLRAFNKLKLALILQFILPGNPCVYYGDEIGMQGFEDPFNRAYYKWDNIDEEIFDYYKSVFNLFTKSISKLPVFHIDTEDNNLLISRHLNDTKLNLCISKTAIENETTILNGSFINHNNETIYWNLYN